MEATRERYDFIVICTKNIPEKYNLAEMVSPLITPGLTSIVLMQNGLNIQVPFVEAFPSNVVMSAVSMIGSFKEYPNRIRHIGPDMLEVGPHYHDGVAWLMICRRRGGRSCCGMGRIIRFVRY